MPAGHLDALSLAGGGSAVRNVESVRLWPPGGVEVHVAFVGGAPHTPTVSLALLGTTPEEGLTDGGWPVRCVKAVGSPV